jgi:putative two-component system response regulator
MIDPESEVVGLDLGAVDYLTKPFSPKLLLKRVELHLFFEAQKRELKRYSSGLEGLVVQKAKTVFELQNVILRTVAELVESRDSVTGGHIERTQAYVNVLARLLIKNGFYANELLSWDIDLLVMSSQLHDVGKIAVRDSILLKPGKLTAEEFEEMKKHAAFGRELIERIEENTPECAFLTHAKILASSHHERWDGNGYPLGLKAEEIPLQGRLMAIVDVYDALTNDRPYKKAFTHEESVEIIKNMDSHFDPLVLKVFLENHQEFARTSKAGGYQAKSSVQLNALFKMVSNLIDIRDGTATGQVGRVRHYLQIFLDVLLRHGLYQEEISAWDIELFLISSQLHDIGKIAISCDILHKGEELTSEEFLDVKSHTEFGMSVVQQIKKFVEDEHLLHHAEALVGSHHEKWDGTGYPRGLKGNEIPLQGRMMAIVDVYDALTNHRPYRDMLDHKEAVDIIKSLSGSHFDPALVDIFLEHEKAFERAGVP